MYKLYAWKYKKVDAVVCRGCRVEWLRGCPLGLWISGSLNLWHAPRLLGCQCGTGSRCSTGNCYLKKSISGETCETRYSSRIWILIAFKFLIPNFFQCLAIPLELALALVFGSGEPQESSGGISRLSVICLRLRGATHTVARKGKGHQAEGRGHSWTVVCPGRAWVIVPLICVN